MYYLPFFSLCMQPGQQHGRRLPSVSSVWVRSIRRSLVSMSLADSTQHIHSLRASGVMSRQAVNADILTVNAFCRSVGILCTVPRETCGLVI